MAFLLRRVRCNHRPGESEMKTSTYQLSVTTQGPLYPPSEVMDHEGNFIVIGALNKMGDNGTSVTEWGNAIVSRNSPVPAFGKRLPYDVIETWDLENMPRQLGERILHTLPVPLPCNNYEMTFAPAQYPQANSEIRASYPFHETPIPDAEWWHGRQLRTPVTLRDWVKARGELSIALENEEREARFRFVFKGLIPSSLYTVMTLREHDLDPAGPTRPAPLGIPNVFISNEAGEGLFEAVLPDPFPPRERQGNRVINVVVLFMSYQMSHGGAIGRYGLGGDIHAQLKLRGPSFFELETKPFARVQESEHSAMQQVER